MHPSRRSLAASSATSPLNQLAVLPCKCSTRHGRSPAKIAISDQAIEVRNGNEAAAASKLDKMTGMHPEARDSTSRFPGTGVLMLAGHRQNRDFKYPCTVALEVRLMASMPEAPPLILRAVSTLCTGNGTRMIKETRTEEVSRGVSLQGYIIVRLKDYSL